MSSTEEDDSSISIRQQCREAFESYLPNDLAKFQPEEAEDDFLKDGFHPVDDEFLTNVESDPLVKAESTEDSSFGNSSWDSDIQKSDQPLPFDANDVSPIDGDIENRVRDLWKHVDKIWERNYQDPAFSEFVAADFPEVYRYLVLLRSRCNRFIEWGSGLGTVSIMASLLGYESYGIEIQPGLVNHANHLAAAYGANCQFATGSFVPDHYQWNPEIGDDSFRTLEHSSDGYEELGLELSEFDLIYAYPWQDEVGLFLDIAKQCGSSAAVLLTYNSNEGVQLQKVNH